MSEWWQMRVISWRLIRDDGQSSEGGHALDTLADKSDIDLGEAECCHIFQ